MMNRIILIGNGFDLAHGLPTSYKDFIQGYWIFQRRRLLEDTSDPTDGLCCIKIDNPDDIKKLEHFSWILDNSMFRFQRGRQQQQQNEECKNFFNIQQRCKGVIAGRYVCPVPGNEPHIIFERLTSVFSDGDTHGLHLRIHRNENTRRNLAPHEAV